MAEAAEKFGISGDRDFFDPSTTVIVAAIDFGTTYSGYAFAFKNKPQEVIVNKNWGDEIGAISVKTPTCVLLDKDKFMSFGYKAEHDYAQFCSTDTGKDFELYRHFKMSLYQEKELNRTTKVISVSGKLHSVMDLFAVSIKYLKEHLLNAVDKQITSKLKDNQIQWVLTIPAIWSDKAKQFMREAAFQAGLIASKKSKQLLFALEPEAASVCCRSLQVHHYTEVPTETMEVLFPPGTKYMIIDAGGGTIDITAHQVQEDGNLIELICANGGDWGGRKVDENFKEFLSEVLGKQFLDIYIRDCPSQWLQLMNDFEKKKKAINMSENTGISIPLSWSIGGKYREVTGKDIEQVLKNASSKGVAFSQGNIIIKASTVYTMFASVLDNITNHVKETLNQKHLENLQYILLVGGFGDSKLLFNRLKKEFSSRCQVLSPHSAALTIVKGAVLFGYKSHVISARMARKTYGAGVNNPFIEGKHDPKRKYKDPDNGDMRCSGLIRNFVCKNELVKINQVKTFDLTAKKDCKDKAHFYCSEAAEVKYTDEPGVQYLGLLKIPLTDSDKLVPIEVKVFFGHTEIKVEIKEKSKKDGEVVRKTIDFL